MPMHDKPARHATPRHGLARVLSKLGIASRTQAAKWIIAGRVTVNGRVVSNPEFPVRQGVDAIAVAGEVQHSAARCVIMLNKPRGLVTTAADERGRDTVYACLEDAGLPWLAPVGRLDKASEGLLLLCNDPVWAVALSRPGSGARKTYHVQVDRIPDPAQLLALNEGMRDGDEWLSVTSARLLRRGQKHAWLEIVLDEGKNRQIRRLLSAMDIGVLRLLRVSIGSLQLGNLAKGAWRSLTDKEIQQLAQSASSR